MTIIDQVPAYYVTELLQQTSPSVGQVLGEEGTLQV